MLRLADKVRRYQMTPLDYERYMMRKHHVTFGNNVKVYESYIDHGFGFLITIGNDVTITNSKIYAHDASMNLFLGKTKVGKVVIGDNVFIGANCVVLPNVKIGNNVIVGAGCVVTKDIPENSIVVGNPMRVIGETSQFLKKHEQFMKDHPVWNVYWQNKTEQDRAEMIDLLEDTWGYDD